MAKRYEAHPGAQDAVGVEDYVVRTADGEAAGTVVQLLRRDGRLLLVVDTAAVPGGHDRRLVAWDDVENVDHEALAVWLRLSQDQLAAAPELEPGGQREEGLSAAERADEVPPDLLPQPEPEPGGPVDRMLMPLLIAFAGAVGVALLVVVAAATALETPWLYVAFIVPAVLAAATVGVMYRVWRRPYEPRGAKKP